MKNKNLFLLLSLFLISFTPSYAQTSLDTLFFVDGKIEAVKISGMTEKSVQYIFPEEGIPISTSKSKLEKLITRSGRQIIFENTSRKKTVFSATDWEKVEVTGIQSEVEGLIRFSNVSGKAKGMTTLSSLEKLQTRAMTKMKMQAAFLGCDVVYMLNQTNSDATHGNGAFATSSTPSSTLSGTAYGVKRINLNKIIDGNYKLSKVYRLRPNDFQLREIETNKFSQYLKVAKDKFRKKDNYYAIAYRSGLKGSNNEIKLLKSTENKLIFLVIDRSRGSKLKYYNLHFKRASL